MFVLIWATLLFSVGGSNSYTGGSVKETCYYGFCITLSEREITAEAGLCAVIPCSFTPGYGFTVYNVVWFKCEPSKTRCVESDIIFRSNNNNRNIQSGFLGRVSLLDPVMSLNNCSIIVNDITESDSGSYQLRVNGIRYGNTEGFTFSPRATVSVKDLTQKPTVMIPPLTEGQQTTLTCTAPGLCSGSHPKITWTWRGTGENDFTGNITAFKTEHLSAVTQRHSSTLTFNLSAEHHGTNVTCKVSFANSITTEETVTLNVTYMKEVEITGNTRLKEGEALNLTCSVESFPPSLITWTKFSDTNMKNGTESNLWNDTLTDQQNDTETYLQEESGMGTFSISNVSAEHSGQYICTAKHLNNTLKKTVDVTVIYMKKPVITGNTTVEWGQTLNLTCSVKSFPSSRITWTNLGSNTNLHSEPNTDLQNNTGSATLVIHKVTAGHSGQYICTAQHLDTILTISADITVTLFPKILKHPGCKVQSEVLTCVCISEGLPLPTIRWPLLKNHTEYSFITTVTNHTVNSTVNLSVKDHINTVVECVSSNEIGETKENLTVQTDAPKEEDQSTGVLKMVSRLEVIIAFFIGVLLSAIICCFVKKCHRTKQKSFGKLDETLEMVTSQEDPLINVGQAVEDDQTYHQEAVEDGEGAVPEEKAALDLDGEPKDVEYASIDFSVLKRRSPREVANTQETTEYAEIKKAVKEEREEEGRGREEEENEVLDGKEEAMTGEDEETKQYVPEEDEGEDAEVYSNVKDIMGEI